MRRNGWGCAQLPRYPLRRRRAPFYESQYSKWSTTALYAGSLFPVGRHVQFNLDSEHENDTGGNKNHPKTRLGWSYTCSSRWRTDDLNTPHRVCSFVPHGRSACYGHCRADSELGQTSPPDDERLARSPNAAPHDLVAGLAPSGRDRELGFFCLWRGCLPHAEAAFYFSVSTSTTVGYDDVVQAKPWRMLGAIDRLIGVLMCGLSTGYFFVVVSRIHQSRHE